MIFKHIHKEVEKVFINDKRLSKHLWEAVPDEDLWEDGELTEREVQVKIINKVLMEGDWILIRRVSDDNEHRNS